MCQFRPARLQFVFKHLCRLQGRTEWQNNKRERHTNTQECYFNKKQQKPTLLSGTEGHKQEIKNKPTQTRECITIYSKQMFRFEWMNIYLHKNIQKNFQKISLILLLLFLHCETDKPFKRAWHKKTASKENGWLDKHFLSPACKYFSFCLILSVKQEVVSEQRLQKFICNYFSQLTLISFFDFGHFILTSGFIIQLHDRGTPSNKTSREKMEGLLSCC